MLAFCTMTSFGQIYNTEVAADLELISEGEFLQITGFADNKTDVNKSLRFVISIFKKDTVSDNTSKNTKEGRFVLGPSQRKSLGNTAINKSEKDQTILLLLIYDENDQVVGKDRVVLNEIDDDIDFKKRLAEKNEVSQDIANSGEDGVIGLRGIVVENTLTKPGRDFYRAYVSAYNFKKINGDKILEVKELLAQGSNTQIQLKSADEVIFQFFVNPRSDYIDQMVDYAIQYTNIYFRNQKKNRNLIKKY